ncbi:MAG TPA: hypothetical protein K8V24_05380 [Limosilactobacillus reuteri]|nr:hypothetical protein [Limosilactobacillus reuteri]
MFEWLRSLQPNDWLQLVSIIASIAAIFISNWIGRREALRKEKYKQRLNRYNNFYVPFIKFFFIHTPHEYLFFLILLDGSFSELDSLIKNNLQYLNSDSAKKYYYLCNKAHDIDSLAKVAREKILSGNFKAGEPIVNFTQTEINAYSAFNDFALSALQESVCLAQELGLEPIGQSVLEIYSDELHRPK